MSDTIIAQIEIVDSVLVEVPAAQGLPGPAGPQGPAGATVLTFTAGQDLGGQRVVVPDGTGAMIYADQSNLAHAKIVVGITKGAAASGDDVDVQCIGELTEPSWNWTPNAPLFLGTNGLLTQTAPTTGFSLVIGIAVTPTTIIINIGESIIKV